MKLSTRFQIALATPAILLLAFISPSLAGEPQPLLGIKAQDLRSFRAGALVKDNYPQEGGVLVDYVYPDGPAEEAGLEEWDIIASSGDTEFDTTGEFIDWLKTTKDGEAYQLIVWRRADGLWEKRSLRYRAAWGIRDAPIANRTAWDGPLSASIEEAVVYISRNGQPERWKDDGYFVAVEYEGLAPVEGFFNVAGKPTKLSVVSSNPQVLKVTTTSDTIAQIEELEREQARGEKDAVTPFILDAMKTRLELERKLGTPQFEFIAPGETKVIVEVGLRKVELPLKVVKSPVSPGDTADQVVQTMGLPDWKSEVYVRWPDAENVDRIFYQPTAGESNITASHWRYKKYPGLVLSIRDGRLSEISTDIDGIPVSEDDLAPPEDLRRWTAKTGHTLDATFMSFRRGKVTLKDAAGKTKDVRLTDLSENDRNYVRRKVRTSDQAPRRN